MRWPIDRHTEPAVLVQRYDIRHAHYTVAEIGRGIDVECL